MKKTVAVMAAAIFIAGQCLAAEEQAAQKEQPAAAKAEVKAQTKCPVMGGAIDKKHFADSDGKRVYFCCPGCIATFNKEPAKYIKQLEDAGITLEKAPAKEEGKAPATSSPAGGCGAGCGK